MKTLNLTDEQYQALKELCTLRQTQDNRSARNPIWAVETERERICDENYSNGEIEYMIVDQEGDAIATENCLNIEDIKELYYDDLDEDLIEELDSIDNIDDLYEFLYYENIDDNLKKMCVEKYYEPVAWFLTDQEAKKYLKYQAHNLNNPRTYVHGCGYSNYGYLPKLMDIMLELKFDEEEGLSNES